MTAPSKVVLDELVDTYIDPLLTHQGFARWRSRWVRDVAGMKHVIGLQAAHQEPKRARVRFSFVYGVAVPAFSEAVWPGSAKSFPNHWDCVMLVRIGRVDAGLVDRGWQSQMWWELLGNATAKEIRELGVVVAETLSDQVLPFFKHFRTLDDVLRFVLEHPFSCLHGLPEYEAAVLYALVGDRKEAARLFSVIMQKYPWDDHARETARRLGVSLTETDALGE